DEVRAATQILVRDILGERSGTVALNVNEIGATVKVDGAIVGVTPLSNLELAGGVHSVEVQKTGFIVFRQDVKVQSAREAAINVALIPSPEFIEEYESEAGFTRTLAWTTLGVGVAALGGAGAAYMLGSGEADDLNADIAAYNQQALRSTVQEQDLQDREGSVARWDTVAVVSAGIGVAALATGVVLFLTGDDPDRYDNLKGSINATASRKENNDEGWFATVSPTGGSFGLRF
ncbi:MAG: PEGA domain-containing protein, partial [Myxococcota bacterium]